MVKVNGPSFLGIGSQRCASTYLNQMLDAYPGVQMATKERNFFNYNLLRRGLDWYLAYFETNQQECVEARGEISPSYAVMRQPEIRLTKELFPDLRIILIVRHPVDRMWSALRRHWTYSYLDDVRDIGKDTTSILAYADQRLPDAFGDYAAIYRNWTSIFDKDRILLVRFDEMKNEPDRTAAQVLNFVGVEPDLKQIQEYRESAPIKNRSKVDMEMPPYVRYYLCRRYLRRTKGFNVLTDGRVQDWVADMERTVSNAPLRWATRYRARSLLRYYPVQWGHRLLDPLRTWRKVQRARRQLSSMAKSDSTLVRDMK